MRILRVVFAAIVLLNGVMVAAALRMRRQYQEQEVGPDEVNAVGVLGSEEKKVSSTSFRGGYLRAVMGGVELDLRDSSIDSAPATIEVTVLMGGAQIRVPQDWNVSNQTTASMGGVEIRANEATVTDSPDLVLTGRIVMGGLEVR